MKLLHVISSLEVGGAQRLLSDLLPIQKEQGINVSLLVFKYIDNSFTHKIEQAGIPIISLDICNFKNPKLILHLRKIIRGFDIIHVHLFPSLYWVAIASIGLHSPKLVWTEHSTNNRRRGKWYMRPIEQWIYRHYHCLISISPQTQESLQRWLRTKGNRFVVMNNGVDTAAFANIRTEIIPYSLIMVARFTPAKDQETIIKALPQIDERAKLRLVGDGETMERCKALAQRLKVNHRVEFLGKRENVSELISESYIGIQSSHWEGFGLTAVEIMSAGRVVVASNVEGLKQIVEGAGEIFKAGDFNQLAAIINHLLCDKDYYQRVAQKCIRRATEYDIHTMANLYKEQYLKL